MFIPFEHLQDSARLWIYTIIRELNEQEVELVEQKIVSFVEQWQTHGKPLRASAKVEEQRFILIAVEDDYQSASGCSIDASVGVLRELETELQVDILNQGKVTFQNTQGEAQMSTLPNIKKLVAEEVLQKESPVFNTLAKTKGEWLTQRTQMAHQTWLKRYF